jgi:hypothetical protein
MNKHTKSNRVRTRPGSAASNGSKRKKSTQGKKTARKELTGNELMMKAWKKIYEARHDRLGLTGHTVFQTYIA